MVVHGYGKMAFCVVLSDDVLVQIGFYLLGLGQSVQVDFLGLSFYLRLGFLDDEIGLLGTIVADAARTAGDE